MDVIGSDSSRALQGTLFRAESRPSTPPRAIRLAYYRYRMTDLATRDRDGLYWRRELLDYHPLAYFCDTSEAPRF